MKLKIGIITLIIILLGMSTPLGIVSAADGDIISNPIFCSYDLKFVHKYPIIVRGTEWTSYLIKDDCNCYSLIYKPKLDKYLPPSEISIQESYIGEFWAWYNDANNSSAHIPNPIYNDAYELSEIVENNGSQSYTYYQRFWRLGGYDFNWNYFIRKGDIVYNVRAVTTTNDFNHANYIERVFRIITDSFEIR